MVSVWKRVYNYGSTNEPYVATSLEERRTKIDFGISTAQMVNNAFDWSASIIFEQHSKTEFF